MTTAATAAPTGMIHAQAIPIFAPLATGAEWSAVMVPAFLM